ncbi:MAG: helix-turn-helix domain-containing protein [Candidatus Poribacteria bacterium]
MAKNLDIKERFIKLRANGESYDKIAKKLSIDRNTAIEWGKQFNKEIANMKSIRLENLIEQFTLSVEDKVKLWGNIVNRIYGTLEERSFSNDDNDKLLDMLCKVQSKLESSFVEPTFEVIIESDSLQTTDEK